MCLRPRRSSAVVAQQQCSTQEVLSKYERKMLERNPSVFFYLLINLLFDLPIERFRLVINRKYIFLKKKKKIDRVFYITKKLLALNQIDVKDKRGGFSEGALCYVYAKPKRLESFAPVPPLTSASIAVPSENSGTNIIRHEFHKLDRKQSSLLCGSMVRSDCIYKRDALSIKPTVSVKEEQNITHCSTIPYTLTNNEKTLFANRSAHWECFNFEKKKSSSCSSSSCCSVYSSSTSSTNYLNAPGYAGGRKKGEVVGEVVGKTLSGAVSGAEGGIDVETQSKWERVPSFTSFHLKGGKNGISKFKLKKKHEGWFANVRTYCGGSTSELVKMETKYKHDWDRIYNCSCYKRESQSTNKKEKKPKINILDEFLDIHLLFRLRGGKGGFGANLRNKKRKKKKKKQNDHLYDASRNLKGNRIMLDNIIQTTEKLVEKKKREQYIIDKFNSATTLLGNNHNSYDNSDEMLLKYVPTGETKNERKSERTGEHLLVETQKENLHQLIATGITHEKRTNNIKLKKSIGKLEKNKNLQERRESPAHREAVFIEKNDVFPFRQLGDTSLMWKDMPLECTLLKRKEFVPSGSILFRYGGYNPPTVLSQGVTFFTEFLPHLRKTSLFIFFFFTFPYWR
ncbi:conserved Plasmodium protein, unknown function [Plasmodium ovale wallikeri]|uniref:SDE2-like domain-containing protein n=1 Tax=Plasmodium ovale wallikeri TaxID=864142 RepID=A0A1A8Z7P7_PLAOA|nr:conserved Plasmodium protein, unknown function [Plasmodium ovale wallikeri]